MSAAAALFRPPGGPIGGARGASILRMSTSSSSCDPPSPLPPAAAAEKSRSAARAEDKCSVGGVCDAFEALASLANEKLDSKATAKIIRLVKWVEPIYEEFVAQRNALASQFGEPVSGEEGKFLVPKDKADEFIRSAKAAAAEPQTVPKKLRLSVEDLDGAKISPADLIRLRWFLHDLEG